MPKVKILERVQGADSLPDGRTLGVRSYEAGDEVEIGDDLAQCFLIMGVAKLVQEKKKKSLTQGAPENK